MSRRLIIVGASVRAAAFSALRAGFEPFAIDCYADRDLAAVCPAVKIDRYPRDFEAALAAAPPAPWIYTGGLENYPTLIERLAALRPLWGNVGAGLRNVRQPQRLFAAAKEAGWRYPSTTSSNPANDDLNCWLVKRSHTSGGLGVRFVAEGETEQQMRGNYYQEYIEGQAASATFVAVAGRASFLGATHQLLGRDVGMHDRPFLYAGSIAPLALTEDEASQLVSLGNLLAGRYQLVGLFGVDFIRAAGGLWLIEVNPRYTASIEVLERATGHSFLALHAAACDRGTVPNAPPPNAAIFAGKQIVYARHSGPIPAKFDQLVDELNPPSQPPGIADLPRRDERIIAGQPVATVFAEGGSPAEVKTSLSQRATRLERVLTPDP
jgi:predicted ATP-grasp superfamily ATP-dependent carboligase